MSANAMAGKDVNTEHISSINAKFFFIFSSPVFSPAKEGRGPLFINTQGKDV
jgi:hypothetical protein